MTVPSPCANHPPLPSPLPWGGDWKQYILLRFNLSPSTCVENVRPIFQVGRLTRKSFPLRPQSIPVGTCLSTHLATRHLPLDSQYCPRPAASGDIESQEASVSLLGSSRGSCLGGWISVLKERISWSLPPFMKGWLQSHS